MASADITVRVTDIDTFRLFVWELQQLLDEMRVGADPYAERLEHALDRLFAGDDEKPEDDDA